MAAVDPDSFVRAHGPEAMRSVIDDALPLRASMLRAILTRGECPDPNLLTSRLLCERDLLTACGAILSIVEQMRAGDRTEIDDESARAQRDVIALAARGRLTAPRLDAMPIDAFTGAPRLFAWVCASRACRILGRRTTFFHARYVLVTSPNVLPTSQRITKADVAAFRAAHGYEATVEWLMSVAAGGPPGTMAWLRRETEAELDVAEVCEPGPEAFGALILDHRRRQTQTWLDPVLAAMARGEPLTDTAARLRQAADIFDGKTGGRA